MMLTNDLLLLIGLLVLLLMVAILLLMMVRMSSQQSNLLVNLMLAEQNRSQSLLNQLRAGPDVMALHALQAATVPDSPSNVNNDRYDGSPVGEYQYQADLAANGLKEQEIPDELYAAGWDGVVTINDGGTPVRFERPE